MRYWDGVYTSVDFLISNTPYYAASIELCMERCLADARCQAFQYDYRYRCYIEYNVVELKSHNNLTDNGYASGMRCSFNFGGVEPETAFSQYVSPSRYTDIYHQRGMYF